MNARLALLLVALAGTAAGCARSASSEEATAEKAAADDSSNAARAAAITDQAYLTADLWNDGQAEVAFYRVRRTAKDASGRPAEEQFLVGTYLVKHRFNAEAMTKTGQATGPAASADATDAFKYALFYELESGSYEFKRHWVANARQRDLRPLKASFSSFDWCSNRYEELAFRPSGGDGEKDSVRSLKRSDDYGNARRRFARQGGAFPAQMRPLLARGLDFSDKQERRFSIALPNGEHVGATARLAGPDTLALPAETGMRRQAAERIAVTYDRPVPAMIAEETGTEETYWRSAGPARKLLKVEGDGYAMTLEKALRSPYWKENVWNRLARVSERP
jgi:hypothetical protein